MMNMNVKRCLVVAALAVVAAAAIAQMPSRRPLLQRGGLPRRVPGAAGAAQQPTADTRPISEQLKDIPKGTNGVPILNFENAPLDLVLMQYASLSEKILLPAPNLPKTQITLTSNGIELDKETYLQAIEALLVMNGVVIEPFDKHFIRAFERKTVRTQGIRTLMNVSTNGVPEKGRVISQLIRLEHITAEEAQKAVEGFKDPNGLFQVFERNNAILVTDTQENVNRMLEIIKELDVPNPVLEEVFEREIKFAVASDIKTYLETIVTESQKDTQKPGATPKQSGGPGFARPTMPAQPNRLLNLNNRPGLNRPAEPAAPTPNAVLTAAVSDADRGMIRGKVLIVADDRSNKLIIITAPSNMKFFEKIISYLDVETTPEVEVEVIRLKYAEAEDVESMLNDLIGASSGSQSKNNQNQNASRGAATTRNLTQGNRPAPTPPRPGASSNPTFSGGNNSLGALSKDNVKILADKRINSIVVMARKADMASIKRVIEDMDQKLDQVLIETVIIEVTLGDDLQTGIDWVQRGRQKTFERVQATDQYGRNLVYAQDSNGNLLNYAVAEDFTGDDGVSASTVPFMQTIKSLTRDGFYNNGSYMLGGGGGLNSTMLGNLVNAAAGVATNDTTLAAANPIGGGVNYLLKSDKLNLAAVIQASKSDSRAKYIASPVVMTVDNKEATIDATENRQFVTGWTAQSGTYGNSGQPTPNYTSKDIGIKLKVTPKINENGTVMLKIEEEYSQFVKDGQSMLIPQNGMYVAGSVDLAVERKMGADVLLENNQTVVFGGLTETSVSDNETGIPILKDIPWIGKWLFSKVVQSEARKELLVFMTPYVFSDAKAAQEEARRRKQVLSDPRPWDEHGWSKSPIADPVSKKEQLRRQALEWAMQDEEHETGKKLEEAKEKRIKDLEEKADKERQEWADKHKKAVLEGLKKRENADIDWRAFIDKLRKEEEEKTSKQEAQAAVKYQEPVGEQPSAPAPAPAPEAKPESTQPPAPEKK